MSFERVYRSREGIREIMKLVDLLSSLVIKNDYEAALNETVESTDLYYEYERAYIKTDAISDYKQSLKNDLFLKDLKEYMLIKNWSIEIIEKAISSDLSELEKIYSSEEWISMFHDCLRYIRRFQYSEKNYYYRQFLGIPNDVGSIIMIKNMDYDPSDTTNPLNKESIGIHTLNMDHYPNTYTHYILRDNIEEIKKEHPDLVYLNFINSKNTPYLLRNLPNYGIISSDKNILTNEEYSYFIKSYNKARAQIILDHIDGHDARFPIYNIMAITNLLYFTVLNYSNTYLEKYALREYSEENLNDILESNGYNSLTSLTDISLKRRIVTNLDELTSFKGTENVLKIILDKILPDSNNEVRRIYLEKEYTINDDYTIKIDTSKSLTDSVKLIFRETVYNSQKELSDSEDIFHDYDSFVNNDDYWGGVEGLSQSSKNSIREDLKRTILGMDFNSILTRYITLTRTIDILATQRETNDLLGLMLSRLEGNYSGFFDVELNIGDLECTPAGLFAATCWIQQMKFSDPNIDTTSEDGEARVTSALLESATIYDNTCLLNSVSVFRTFGDLTTAAKVKDYDIIDGVVTEPEQTIDITPDLFKISVSGYLENYDDIDFEILKYPVPTAKVDEVLQYDPKYVTNIDIDENVGYRSEKIEDFIIVYRYYDTNGVQLGEITPDTTFGELLEDYYNQCPQLVKKITDKLANSHDYREYAAWKYIENMNYKDKSFAGIFKGETSYIDFIKKYKSESLLGYIMDPSNGVFKYNEITDEVERDMSNLVNMQDTIETYFKNWVSVNISDKIYANINGQDNNYIKDMIVIFNEFLSVYSELYTVSYDMQVGDNAEFKLQMFYNPLYLYIQDKYNERISLTETVLTTVCREYEQNLSFDYNSFTSVLKTVIEFIDNDPDSLKHEYLLTQMTDIFDRMSLDHNIFQNILHRMSEVIKPFEYNLENITVNLNK